MKTIDFNKCVGCIERASKDNHSFSWGREPNLSYWKFIPDKEVRVVEAVIIQDGCTKRSGIITNQGIFVVLGSHEYWCKIGDQIKIAPVNSYPFYVWRTIVRNGVILRSQRDI